MSVKTAKEILKEKMGAVVPTPNTTKMRVESIHVPNLIRLLGNTTKSNFKKQVLSLKEILGEKLQFLQMGKPLIIDHEQESANDLAEDIDLQATLFAGVRDEFEHGVSRVIIEPLGKGKVLVSLADPNFPNVVYKYGKLKQEAVYWKAFKSGFTQYWKRTRVTEKFIYNDIYEDSEGKNGSGDFDTKKSIKAKAFNKKLQNDSMSIKAKMKNTMGFINVVEIPYVPVRDMSKNGFAAVSPAKRLEELQVMLNEATGALRLELYLNRTKMLIDQDMLADADKEKLQKIADENILALVSDSGDAEGNNKLIEIMQGDPKITEYWVNITNIISMAVQALKLSELGESDSTTATDAIFNKGNDVETFNALATFKQRYIAEILEKALAIKEGRKFSEIDLNIKDWSVQMLPNVIMNEAKMTDIVTAQLGAGLINMVQAKVKLEGISRAAAEESLNQEENYVNPSLDAMSSFSGDQEDDEEKGEPKGKELNPQPEKTKGGK